MAEAVAVREPLVDVDRLEEILARHGFDPSSVIAVLQDVQEEYGYLPREALTYISDRLGVPLSQVYSLATFFRAFSLKPKGRHRIVVCMGTACHVRGSPRVLEEVCRILKVEPGETTDDLMFTVETVNCVGACALGPIVIVDGKYHGHMTPTKVRTLLKRLGAREK